MSDTPVAPGNMLRTLIERDMQDSYLRYSMSVIVSRALPDARDGLKPVQRRILYGMHDLGVYPGKAYKKSARIVGDVIGKYHPHGDSAVYETLVRMAQDFSLRYPLVDGQGNFGSVDGDSAAAMRYTEARMARPGETMLEDLDKSTVDFGPNYDDSMEEPLVLPSVLPNLMVNGATGIAVGMATSLAPHNLREITAAIRAYIQDPDIAPEDLILHVQGPDFPTGGIICGRAGIRSALLTGRGKVVVRARMEIEPKERRIIVTEIPFQVNKALMLQRMAELVKEKKLEGISELRDESDRNGMRVVIELRRDAMPEVVQNQLYKFTQLQETFSIYNLALVDKRPVLLTLKDMIKQYVDHRHQIVIRSTQHDLKKAKDRAHIVEGLLVAVRHIDEVVRIIRSSPDTDTAKKTLESTYSLSEIQSQAIVDMRLRALTGLEIEKLEGEHADLMARIADLEDILARFDRRMQIILTRLEEITAKLGDERRTSIEEAADDLEMEDLIPDEDNVITLSRSGYVRRVPLDTFRTQGRGGKGVIGAGLKDEDVVQSIFVASSLCFLLFFTNQGRAHWTKVYRIPEGQRTGKGLPVVNLLRLAEGEKVQTVVPIRSFEQGGKLVFVTRKGMINKMDVQLFSRPRRDGINAIGLDEGDELISVLYARNASNLLIGTRLGQAICFPAAAFRSIGRGTRGVRGMRLEDGDTVVGMVLLEDGAQVLTITEKGMGKRTEAIEYRVTGRGGKGVRNLRVTDKTGEAIAIETVLEDYDIIITSEGGKVIRISASEIRLVGRDAQGVRVFDLPEDDKVMDAVCLPSVEDLEHQGQVAREQGPVADLPDDESIVVADPDEPLAELPPDEGDAPEV